MLPQTMTAREVELAKKTIDEVFTKTDKIPYVDNQYTKLIDLYNAGVIMFTGEANGNKVVYILDAFNQGAILRLGVDGTIEKLVIDWSNDITLSDISFMQGSFVSFPKSYSVHGLGDFGVSANHDTLRAIGEVTTTNSVPVGSLLMTLPTDINVPSSYVIAGVSATDLSPVYAVVYRSDHPTKARQVELRTALTASAVYRFSFVVATY